MAEFQTVTLPVRGMDCMECTQHVQHAIANLPGVAAVDVFLSSEKAVIRLDPLLVDVASIRHAVAHAGYQIPEAAAEINTASNTFTRVFGIIFGLIVLLVVFGEWLGLFEAVTSSIPWPVGWLFVAAAGFPVFRNVIRAALNRQIISHTLMSLGVLAALAVGEWTTALVIVLFMRVGNVVEGFTTDRARRAVRQLTALLPQTARIEQDGAELEIPVDQLQIGATIIVRPGEQLPADGAVISGQATIDQSAITGESMPVEVGPGAHVFAATIAQLGSLKIRVTHVGPDTTFGRVVRLVEEAEAHRAEVQRLADKVSAYYLPVVAAIALLTFLLRRDPLAAAAVLVVACSCSFALATPIAMLATIGAAAQRGLLIKGGKYLESLARADTLLIDKTGTLTLGRPHIPDILTLDGLTEDELLRWAASAERYSEHPLAEAVRTAAVQRHLTIEEPHAFQSIPGHGVRAQVNGYAVSVGSRRLLEQNNLPLPLNAAALEAQGKTVLFVLRDNQLLGCLAASDTLRDEVPQALIAVRALGIRHIELLTGDNEHAAASIAHHLAVDYRAHLLPEDKIAIVKQYQAEGHTVIMIGDGVNDAPALAQADIGIAMGAAGTGIALEAAHVALLRDDWTQVPQLLAMAARTMRVVRFNIGFTTVYNVLGLSLAALGLLPPILAAAAQSFPDLGILANSSRLLRQKE